MDLSSHHELSLAQHDRLVTPIENGFRAAPLSDEERQNPHASVVSPMSHRRHMAGARPVGDYAAFYVFMSYNGPALVQGIHAHAEEHGLVIASKFFMRLNAGLTMVYWLCKHKE